MPETIDLWQGDLPSITGQDAERLAESTKLTVWGEVRSTYETFVSMAINGKEVRVLLVIGEWGLGKTSSFRAFGRHLIEDYGGIAVMVPAREVFSRFYSFYKQSYGREAEAIAKAILVSAAVRLGARVIDDLTELYKEINKKAGKENAPIFVFLDEFEDILEKDFERQSSLILDGIAGLVNGECPEFSVTGSLAGKLHLILAMTPMPTAGSDRRARRPLGGSREG